MNRLLFATLTALLLMSSAASGQTTVIQPVPPTTVLAFDHDGVNTDGYAILIDGVRSVVAVTMLSGSTVTRTTPFPALTPGTHTIEFVAFVMVDGVAVDSVKSETLTVRVVVVPSAPGIPRIIVVSGQSVGLNAPFVINVRDERIEVRRARISGH